MFTSVGMKRAFRASIRRSADWFSVRNRRRKARVIVADLHAHRAGSALLVGVGGDTESYSNIVERAVVAEVGLSVGCGLDHRDAGSFHHFVQCDARALPFADGAFDMVVSNAVVEHVGGAADQSRFVREHARVGRQWALTTPNRWFPVEAHAKVVVKHWSPAWRSGPGRTWFTRLLSRRELRGLLPPGARIRGRAWSPTFIATGAGPPHRTRTPMDPDRARELLEAERRRLQGIVDAATETEFGQAEQERGSDVLELEQHPADAAQETYEREQELSIIEHAQAELGEVEHAMRKLDDGTYGLDEETGKPIPDERLEVLPATRYDVETKRLDEKRAGLPDDRVHGDPTATSGGGRLAR
jgi:RNA polymerase-binding transcription factor DksA